MPARLGVEGKANFLPLFFAEKCGGLRFFPYLCTQKRAKLLMPGNGCKHHCPRLTAVLAAETFQTKHIKTMATAIRAIPTLYGKTATAFENEAMRTEQNPGTQDYRHEAKVVSDFLKTTSVL